ncbi:MAG: hypothetical protein HKO05_11205, partial [Erythrobacter sp.]|nr:hypothetical protein [Erythrobacter sp.]
DSHPTFTADDLQALGSVDVVATDIDGDTATSSVSVSVSDDVPMAFTPVNLTDTTGATGTTQDDALPNDGTANVTRLINDPDNDGVGTDFIGADGFGSLTFVNGTDGDQLENTSAETVTSGGLPVYLFGFGTGILIATTDNTNTDAGAVVFTMTLNPGTGAGDDASYTIDFDQPLDDGSGTVLSDFSAIRPNNYDWVGFTSEGTLFDGIDNDGEDILITAFNANTLAAGTVNMSSSDIGSNNQWVDEDETVRIDFVIDGTGAGNEKTPQAYGFDGHLDVTNASFTIIEVKSGGFDAIVTVALFDDDDSGALQDLNGSPVNVLAGSVVVTDSGGNDITGSGAIVVYNGDGTVTISGLAPGDNIAFEGDGLFNAFEITGGNGDDFSLGAFGFTSAIAGRDVPLSFDIQSEDADGDTSTGSIDVTVTTVAAAPLAAPTSSQSIQSFSTSTTLPGDPLTDPSANDNGSGSGMASLSSIQFQSALRIGTRMSEISAVAALSGAVLLSEQIAIEPASTAFGADTAFDMLSVLPTGIGATFAPELSGIDSFDPSSLLSLSVAGSDASDLASLLGTQDSLSEGRWSIQSVQAEPDQFEPLSVIESQGEATPAMALPTSSGVDASMEALLMLDPAQDLAALDGSGTADAVGAVMSEIVAGAQLDAIIDRFDDQSSVSDYLVTASGGPDVGILDHHFEAGVALIDAAQLDTDQAEAAIAATAQA